MSLGVSGETSKSNTCKVFGLNQIGLWGFFGTQRSSFLKMSQNKCSSVRFVLVIENVQAKIVWVLRNKFVIRLTSIQVSLFSLHGSTSSDTKP